MDLTEALRSTGAVRDFRPDPVPDDVVYRLLDTARFAPNGGNRQAWHVVVVRDPAVKERLRDLYLPGWYEYLAQMEAGLTPFAAVTDHEAELAARARASELEARLAAQGPGFAEQFHRSPVLLVLLADLRNLATVDRDLDRYTLVGGASIYPFAWSLLLAAHQAGLGGVLTTMPIRQEPALKELLGVPAPLVAAGVIALGYPAGPRATRLRRNPVESFTTVDRYDGAAFTGSARISPWRIPNQASGDALHARQAAARSSSSAGVARPRSTACSANADATTRSAHMPPHQARSASDAKHQADAVASTPGEPRGARPLQQVPPGVGFGVVAARDLVVEREPAREARVVGEPRERRRSRSRARRPRHRVRTPDASPPARRPDP